MKKALHITNHIGTIANIQNVFTLLGELDKLVTIKCPLQLHISQEYANILWISYEEIVRDFDTIIITDTAMYARAFFQNLDKHNLRIIVYVTNRFDWGFFDTHEYDRPAYTQLYVEMSKHPRVVFCADNRYDQYYCSLSNIQFYYGDVVRLTPSRSLLYNHHSSAKTSDEFHKINTKDTAFIYNRGSPIYLYMNLLNNQIPFEIYGRDYGAYRDITHISEYKCIIHLPYQTNIQSLWENLGYNNVYMIPSRRYIEELITTMADYYWEERRDFKSLDLAEWYQPELSDLFVYFDSIEDLYMKFYNTDFSEKRNNISKYMDYHNVLYIHKWKGLLDLPSP
jgi:hypothetical protein